MTTTSGLRASGLVLVAALGLAAAQAACGSDGASELDRPGGGNGPAPGDPVIVPAAAALADPIAFGPTGVRRQTRTELRRSLVDLFGVDPTPLFDRLPVDVVGTEVTNPFDNDAELQDVSTDLIARLGDFATAYAALVVAKPAAFATLAGCTPSKPDDAACFDKLVRRVGRLAFRRPVTDDEVARFAEMLVYAREANDFGSAVDGFVRVVVQHPEFLYRIETGTPSAKSPGMFELEDRHIASRMAFLLWGRGPDEALLDAADAKTLKDPAVRLAQARRMLADPRAMEQWRGFHAQWLGYANVTPPPALAADLSRESSELIDRVVFHDKRPWLDVFRMTETFLTAALAQHYGMKPPATPGWVAYEGPRGGGILSHGDFLMQGSKFGDTSPTLRGYRIVKRLFCKELGTIPPGIDTDNPPAGSPTDCKPQRYSMRTNASCKGCHTQTDDIGFGLENFGPTGEWRDTEPNLPSCSIDGKGSVYGKAFSGPRELGDVLAAAPELAACADRQLFRFALGRRDTADDATTLKALDAQLAATGGLETMLQALVEAPAIGYRIERSTP